jgi:hypothetical protein
MTDIVRKLHQEYVGEKYPFQIQYLDSGSRPSGVSYAWGCPTSGEDTRWATYADGDRVRIEYKRWYGTYLGDTDTHVLTRVVVDGVTLLNKVD